MGYPMSYMRVLGRSRLFGGDDYGLPDVVTPRVLSGWDDPSYARLPIQTLTTKGDLRRLEHDQRDEWHLSEYARRAGVTSEQAKAVLDAFFTGDF